MIHFHLGSIISHIQVRFSGVTAHFPWAWLLTDCVVGSENHGSQECTFDFVSWCSPESHRQTWRSCVPEHPPSCILVEMLRILCRKQAHPARGVLQWSGSSLEVQGSTTDAITGAQEKWGLGRHCSSQRTWQEQDGVTSLKRQAW